MKDVPQDAKSSIEHAGAPGSGKVNLLPAIKSRDALNISPEELMERFVRGDGSRSTEGSGLGLSIAKSFTELQKGTMDIGIDGDLFKVTLRFAAL